MSQISAKASGTFLLGGDLEINRLGFGAMRITGPGTWGEPEDRDEALRVLRRLPELGVNFIDTADSYGPDVSENLIREALHPYEGLVIATKAGQLRNGPGKWVPHGHPAYLRQEVLMSLRKLNVERIDLWLTLPDGSVRGLDSQWANEYGETYVIINLDERLPVGNYAITARGANSDRLVIQRFDVFGDDPHVDSFTPDPNPVPDTITQTEPVVPADNPAQPYGPVSLDPQPEPFVDQPVLPDF